MKTILTGFICFVFLSVFISCATYRDAKDLVREFSGKRGTEIRRCGCIEEQPNGREIIKDCVDAYSESECARECRRYDDYIYKEDGLCRY